MEYRDQYLRVLNGKTATATAFSVVFNLGTAAVVCTSGCMYHDILSQREVVISSVIVSGDIEFDATFFAFQWLTYNVDNLEISLIISHTTALITLNDISAQPLHLKSLATVTAGLNVVLWIALISFPFIQVRT